MDDSPVMGIHLGEGDGFAPAADFFSGVQCMLTKVFIFCVIPVKGTVTAAFTAFSVFFFLRFIFAIALGSAAVFAFGCIFGGITIDINVDFRIIDIFFLHHSVEQKLQAFQGLTFASDDSAGIAAGDDQMDP